MDIAKIRKKAHSKDSGSKPVEKPVKGPAEDDNRGDEKKQVVVGGKGVLLEGIPAEKIAVMAAVVDEAGDDNTAGIPSDDDITEADAGELVELLTFSLSNEEYAFRVNDVEEVLRLQKITMVPTMPDYVLGITSLRGKIIPVIDLKIRLSLQEKSLSTNSPDACPNANPADDPDDNPATGNYSGMEKKIMIISGPKGMIGATIDKVMGVVRLPLSGMLQPPGHLDEKELKFIEGIVVIEKRFISVIHSGAAMDIEAG